jgi:hypothetical protein
VIADEFFFPVITPSNPSMKLTLLLSLCLFPLVASVISCKEKGPAEKAGEKIDKTVEKVKDAVDPKGPAEKAGEKIDKALGK